MATTIRPELSQHNKYYVEKHRQYELKHFCLQYPFWKRAYLEEDGLKSSRWEEVYSKGSGHSDPTARTVERRSIYFDKMKLVEQAAIAADPDLSSYILKGVTEGLSYNYLKSRLGIPCGKDMYYDRYRRFFWILDKTRN